MPVLVDGDSAGNRPVYHCNISAMAERQTLNGRAAHNLISWLIMLTLGTVKENVLCRKGSLLGGAIKEEFPEEKTALSPLIQ